MVGKASRGPLAGLIVAVTGFMLVAGAPQGQDISSSDLDRELDQVVRPILDEFCTPCHSGEDAVAGMDLEFDSAEAVAQSRAKFEKVIGNLRSQVMPPPDMDAPTIEQREKVVAWIQNVLAESEPDVGRVTIRRLNRREYDNTIQDLLYTELNLSESFPSDDVGYGFDNIGDVLTLTPLHLEQYLKAARIAIDTAIPTVKSREFAMPLDRLPLPDSARVSEEGGVFFFSNGSVSHKFTTLTDGEYELQIVGSETPAGPEHAKAAVHLNGMHVHTIVFDSATPKSITIPINIRGGAVEVGISFINDFYNPQDPNPRNRDRNLRIDSVMLLGPTGAVAATTAAQRRLIFVQPSATKSHLSAAREVIARFTSRAYRRPATDDELNRLMSLYTMVRQSGDDYQSGIKVMMQAVLVNPNFLFRVELGADTSSGRNLSGYELASRLSYFLWNSMPDDGLIAEAKSGALATEAGLIKQIDRMLADPKAERFFEDFTSQWLQIRRLSEASPDPELFPNFSPELRADLAREPVEFFADALRNRRPLREFVTSNSTMLNGRLARHYRIPGAFDARFRRVDVSAHNRGGVLGMGALLTVTSNPNRTSPVKRGKFVMEEILGTPPPPQPPNVGVLEENTAFEKPKSMRERLDRHRSIPECASCHAPLDAFGFALENFDAVGKWRLEDSGIPIDSSGNAPGDIPISGFNGLKTYLANREADLLRTMTEKMMIYALGRGLSARDSLEVRQMLPRIKKRGNDLNALITEIVLSDQFRKHPSETLK